jgi:hypothetical protein
MILFSTVQYSSHSISNRPVGDCDMPAFLGIGNYRSKSIIGDWYAQCGKQHAEVEMCMDNLKINI